MLPAQATLAIQTDILPTQNIGLVDQNQPQIYSLLASSNSPNSMKKQRRKKPTKLDETIPVTVNPQMTITPTGVTFTAPQYRSTSLPEPISSFVAPRVVNDQRLPFRLCLDHNSYDANNNINHNQIPPFTMSLNPSLPGHVQQTPARSSPVVNTNWIPQLVTKSQLFGVNQLLNNNINERTVPVPLLQQSEHNYLQSSFMFPDQVSRFSHSSPIPSSLSPISISSAPSVQPKRKYSKRHHLSASVEQQQLVQQTSPCPTTFTQSNVSNGLPSIIPASVTAIPTKSEEQPLPLDIPTASSFVSLTPPGSIKSPPTSNNSEVSLIPVQQHSVPFTTTNIADIGSTSKHYFPAQRFSYPRKTITDSSISNLPSHFHRFLPTGHTQYCMVPSNLIPTNILAMTYSTMLPEPVTNNSSVSVPTDMKKERKRREKTIRQSKIMQTPTVEMVRDQGSFTSKSLTTDICARKKRKHKNSSTKDIRTKKQLRRITRQNRLAVLKFMMRKRKQQKPQPISIPQLPDSKVEQMAPELVCTPVAKPKEMERNLPDIIAPSLKISLNATQQIESISLYYHRRRKPGTINENSSKSSIATDNGLGLLIEAVEFMETLRGNLKSEPPSNK